MSQFELRFLNNRRLGNKLKSNPNVFVIFYQRGSDLQQRKGLQTF
jgi:hypothetical protein